LMTNLADTPRAFSDREDVTDADNGEEFEPSPLQLIWRVFWLNRLLVAGIVATAIVIALVATLLMTPQYTTTARVQVNRIEAKVSDVEGVQPQGDVLDYDEFYNTQYALLE